MSLASLIQSVPDWTNKTAQQVYDALNAATEEYIDRDLWTWAGIALVAGPEGAEGLRQALESNNMAWMVYQLGGKGVQLSHESVQPVLYAFAQAGVPNMQTLALSVKRNISKLQQAGITTTLEEVALLKTKLQKEDAAKDRLQTYIEALNSWDGTPETEPVL